MQENKKARFARAAYRRRLQYLISEAYRWRETYRLLEDSETDLERSWLAEERHASMDAVLQALEAAMFGLMRMP